MKRLFSIAIDCVWIAGLYFGLTQGVEGALNIGLFLTGLMFFFSFGLFMEEVRAEVSKLPRWAIARSVAFDLVALGLLVWHGWIWTAIAVAWSTIMYFGAWSYKPARGAA